MTLNDPKGAQKQVKTTQMETSSKLQQPETSQNKATWDLKRAKMIQSKKKKKKKEKEEETSQEKVLNDPKTKPTICQTEPKEELKWAESMQKLLK